MKGICKGEGNTELSTQGKAVSVVGEDDGGSIIDCDGGERCNSATKRLSLSLSHTHKKNTHMYTSTCRRMNTRRSTRKLTQMYVRSHANVHTQTNKQTNKQMQRKEGRKEGRKLPAYPFDMSCVSDLHIKGLCAPHVCSWSGPRIQGP
jgi:hypothetical protein